MWTANVEGEVPTSLFPTLLAGSRPLTDQVRRCLQNHRIWIKVPKTV